jgi:ribosomal protein L19
VKKTNFQKKKEQKEKKRNQRMFNVGDKVKVIKVIDVGDSIRTDQKKVLLGAVCVIEGWKTRNDTFPGHVYWLKGCNRPFHSDELELFDEKQNVERIGDWGLPQIGDWARVVGSADFHQVCRVKIVVEYVSPLNNQKIESELLEIVPKHVVEQRDKDLLTKKRDEMCLKAKEMLDEVAKLSTQLAAMQ